MGKSVDISIITLNYNAGNLIIENLQYLKKTLSKKFKFEVIVADNKSTDGSFTQIKKQFPWVKTVDNKANIGFAAGNNRAVKYATGKYIVFLNPDMRIEDKSIWEKLVVKMEKSQKIGAIGCKIVFPSGKYDLDSKRSFPTPWNSFAHFSGLSKIFKGTTTFDSYYLGNLDYTKDNFVDAIPGSFMFIRREAGEKVGWWDEDYFFYGEDLDLCYRLQLYKWKVLYTPVTFAIHYKGISSGIKKESRNVSTASIETRRRVSRASVDAMRIFFRKHYNKKYPFIVRVLVSAGFYALEKRRLARYMFAS
jgi:GT2 family glycosyltransferase